MDNLDEKQLKDLVSKIDAGDEDAFLSLLNLYEKRIYAFSYRMCGNRQDAEDGTQEVFLSALKSLHQFRWEVPLLSWLFKIAANRCRRMKKLKVGQPRFVESLDIVSGADDAVKRQADPAATIADPLEETMRLRREAALQAALENLEKDARLLIILRDMQGQSTKETAQIMGMSEGAVKTALHRSRKQLKGLLGHVEF